MTTGRAGSYGTRRLCGCAALRRARCVLSILSPGQGRSLRARAQGLKSTLLSLLIVVLFQLTGFLLPIVAQMYFVLGLSSYFKMHLQLALEKARGSAGKAFCVTSHLAGQRSGPIVQQSCLSCALAPGGGGSRYNSPCPSTPIDVVQMVLYTRARCAVAPVIRPPLGRCREPQTLARRLHTRMKQGQREARRNDALVAVTPISGCIASHKD